MKLFTKTLICVAAFLPSLLLAQTAEYTLDIDTAVATVGDTVTVTWVSGSADVNRDWIGLYETGASNTQYEDYAYISNDTGSFDFIVNEPGEYEFRYLLNNSYEVATISETFVVEADGGGDTTYELTLSDTLIEVGEAITVTWTTNSTNINRDWIGLYEVGASNSSYEDWGYVGATTGSFDFVVDEPGEYEFRYLLKSGYEVIVVSDVFTVENESGGGETDYTLTLSDTTIESGDVITVTWVSGSADINRDWIGLYEVGASNSSYEDYAYVSNDAGSFDFTVNEPGEYEFRYLLNNSYEVATISETFVVEAGGGGGGTDYTLTLSDTTIESGDVITVTWTSGSDEISRDWIGLYETGASNTQYEDYAYVTNDAGSFDFTINEPGTYEFRYLLKNRYEVVATSETFVVEADGGGGDTTYELTLSDTLIEAGEAITVTWTTNSTNINRDWIGLYEVGANNTQHGDWEYVYGVNGSSDFTISTPGTYEFRYLLNDGYEVSATSETFVVEAGSGGGTDNYSVVPDQTVYNRGDIAEVTWSAPSGAVTFLDWIGLYEPDTADTEYLYYEYVDFFSNVETFPLDNDGVFEFRMFTSNTFNKVATSEEIIVLNSTSTSCTLDTSDITNFPPPGGPIIALGDSITFGYGASAGEDYVSELEDRLGTSIINEGISGDTTRSALARLQTDVLDENPSAVIVLLGGNDEIRRFYENLGDSLEDRGLRDELDELAESLGYDWMSKPLIPREETFSNLESILEQIQSTGAVTILVGFDAGIFDQQIADDYQQIADNTNSFFVPDIYDGIFGRTRYMSDLVHPNDAGYDIIADRIQPSVACVI